MVDWWSDGEKTWSVIAKTVKLLFHMHYFCVKRDAFKDIGKWKRLKLIRVYFVNNKCVWNKLDSTEEQTSTLKNNKNNKNWYNCCCYELRRSHIWSGCMYECVRIYLRFSFLCILHIFILIWSAFLIRCICLLSLLLLHHCCCVFLHFYLLLPLLLLLFFLLIIFYSVFGFESHHAEMLYQPYWITKTIIFVVLVPFFSLPLWIAMECLYWNQYSCNFKPETSDTIA